MYMFSFSSFLATLEWFCKESVVMRATSGGGAVTPSELTQDVPDEVVDISWTDFSCLHIFCS